MARKFGKGNKASEGVSAGKTGRPVDESRQALKDLLMRAREGGNPSLRDKAITTLDKAMDGVDDSGNVTLAAVRACERVLNTTDGMPTQRHELEHTEPLIVQIIRRRSKR